MRESKVSLRDRDMGLSWSPPSTRKGPTQLPTFQGGVEGNQVDPAVPTNLETPPRVVEITEPVKEYDQPRPWRYVRWRRANERQAVPVSDRQGLPSGNCVYKVMAGEGLDDVATKFDTYAEALAEANKILNPHNLATGQLLWVPKTYLIKKGNTLWSLSRSFGVSIPAIQKANGIENPNLIFADDILVVPEEWS